MNPNALRHAPQIEVPFRRRLEAVPEYAGGDFEHLSCSGCGEWFPAPEGAALLYSLKSSCPACGGEFVYVPGSPTRS